MDIKIRQYWFNIRSSLWFLPAVMGLAAVVLAFGLIELDNQIDYDKIPIDWFVYGGNPQGARSVLSTIASSMVTIAGVTFSITLVALTMASSQFGPRLLRNFIADKGNQFVIGTFIATFIYSLIVLLTIRGTENDEFIPKISVIFGFLLAVLSLGVIIYFIHHVSTSIQADFVIKSSFTEFQRVVKDFMSTRPVPPLPASTTGLAEQVRQQNPNHMQVSFTTSGYVQSIDYEGIGNWAANNRAVVHLLVHPGSFATIHQEFASIYSNDILNETCRDELRRFLVTGYQRTPNQDILFSIKQIVEVGVRSLSPGINDPHTAITCLHWLGAALAEISSRHLKSPVHQDQDGAYRVIKSPITYEDMADACFDELKLYGKTNPFVIMAMLQEIGQVLKIAGNEALQKALLKKADLIYEEMRNEWKNSNDLAQLDKTFRGIRAATTI